VRTARDDGQSSAAVEKFMNNPGKKDDVPANNYSGPPILRKSASGAIFSPDHLIPLILEVSRGRVYEFRPHRRERWT